MIFMTFCYPVSQEYSAYTWPSFLFVNTNYTFFQGILFIPFYRIDNNKISYWQKKIQETDIDSH